MHKFLEQKWNVVVVLAIFGAFYGGMYVGARDVPAIDKVTLANKETAVETQVDFDPFWKVWNIINEKSPNAEETSDQERVYGAISGLVDSLDDPYSVFLDPAEAKQFKEDIQGSFSGVGMEVDMKDGILTVIAPLKGTPADKAGIKSGDKILKIDNVTTTDFTTTDQAVKLIRGKKGTEVTLTILREGEDETREIKIVRDTIQMPTLDTEFRPDAIFVVKLYSFSGNSANLFRNAMREFALSKTDKLLLDLRGNPGGYLSSAVDVASWFLPTGKVIVTEDYSNEEESEIFRSKGLAEVHGVQKELGDKLKFIILIDEGSASASEIVAGAMQDHKRAKLVGTKSYGKGSVQEMINVTKNTILKLTIAKWLTPHENLIAEKGLTPDYEVKYTKADAENKKDPQMDKAVELLNNWK